MDKLVKKIKDSEGFKSHPYTDNEGFPTIGYGTKLGITKEEGEILLIHRLKKKKDELLNEKPLVKSLDKFRQDILFEMAYQLGTEGLLSFKKMWLALENNNYNEASKQMLDSQWAIQTPHRAKRLADSMNI